MINEVLPDSYNPDTKNINPYMTTEDFLELIYLNLEDFKGKNVTSIGWWFWIFEVDLAEAGANVTIVDPVFSSAELIEEKLQDNINWLKGLIEPWDEYREQIKETFLGNVGVKAKDSKLDSKRKELITHLEKWKENKEKYGLVLNPSSGDKIEWIEENSQDFVLIWHTLSRIKEQKTVINILRELLKLLKPGWEVYIIDYEWKIDWLMEKLRGYSFHEFDVHTNWSTVCVFKKKGLDDFLDWLT